jgi:hypothetical protein
MCLKQIKSLFTPPYEFDDSDILVLETLTEDNTKQMIYAATQTKSKNVKIKNLKNV